MDRIERKLSAILAADVAGCSRLMGIDEEGALSRLTVVCRDIFDPSIVRNRGRIVKTTGDGLLTLKAAVVNRLTEWTRGEVSLVENLASETVSRNAKKTHNGRSK